MAALDTNVLVRFLVKDDAAQLGAAKALISRSVAQGEALFVPVTVALELEWVLRSNFGFAKAAVVQTLSQLLGTSEMRFESEPALELALVLYGRSTAEFSDCLHVALANLANERPLWTFDRAAAKLAGAQLMPA